MVLRSDSQETDLLIDAIGNTTAVHWGVVIVASLGAAVTDVRNRRIPNVLTLPLVLTGLMYALVYAGLPGLGKAVVSCVILATPYVLLFVFAGGGAGDAKMMGAIGAWLGIEAGLVVLVAVATTGALFGIANLAAKRQLGSGLGRIGASFYIMMATLCTGRRGSAVLRPNMEDESQPQDRRLTIPYGPAIFIGVCIGAFWVHSWNG